MDEHYTAGYFLVRMVPRPQWLSECLPAKILSASRCICPQFPGPYAYTVSHDVKKERAEKFDAIGIPPSERDDAMEWAVENFRDVFGWSSTFFELDDALSARTQFFGEDPEMTVVGVGLAQQLVTTFRGACRSSNEARSLKPTGIMEMLDSQQPLEPRGELLGYELLNVSHGMLSCSWVCCGLEQVLPERLEFELNSSGMMTDFDDARRCFDYLESTELSGNSDSWLELGADPGPWIPWRLVRYR